MEPRIQASDLPRIIQGGMGIGVSGWELARSVSMVGQLGVVSGTSIDTVLIRRLQDGKLNDNLLGAMRTFPDKGYVEEVLLRYYQPDGRLPNQPYKLLPLPSPSLTHDREKLLILAAFSEVTAAKEGHSGVVGMNLLTVMKEFLLPTIFGAMMAKVDVLLMGAGIPREIPEVLRLLSKYEDVGVVRELVGRLESDNLDRKVRFSPRAHPELIGAELRRPLFLPIVSSHTLASSLVKKTPGVDGLVVESHRAGGHNAPPRAAKKAGGGSSLEYSEKDKVDFEVIRALGVPFWLAGGQGGKDGLSSALTVGAHGVQVGSLFALAEESGFRSDIKMSLLERLLGGNLRVETSPSASPTGFPFKVAQLPETAGCLDRVERVCDLGYLRKAYVDSNSKVQYGCPAGSREKFAQKGGDPSECEGRLCICNGLFAAIGSGQVSRHRGEEVPLVTLGDSLEDMGELLKSLLRPQDGKRLPRAAEIVSSLLQGP